MRKNRIVTIIICVLVASIPLMMNYLIEGHDLVFHLNRIEGLYEGIKNGSIPVKIQPLWFKEHGYPIGVFYGDWLLYIPVLFRFLGLQIQSAYQLFIYVVNFLTVVLAYYSFKRLFKSNNLGLAGAIIYTLSLYRMENIYSRAAVGEYCAMIFFPIIFLGMYEILSERKVKYRISPVILVAVGLTCLIHTHLLSCEMVAIFIILACVICIRKVMKRHVFVQLALAVVITIILSLDFLIPFLDYYSQGYFVITAEDWFWRKIYIQDHGLFLNQIFSIFVEPQGSSLARVEGIEGEITFSLGLTVIVGVVLYIYTLINTDLKKRKDELFGIGLYSFVMFGVAVYMSTCHFPWNKLADTNEIIHSLISTIQFPWRFLSIASFFSTVLICVALKELKNKLPDEQKYLPILSIGFSLIISVGWYSNALIFNTEYGAQSYYYDAQQLNIRDVTSGEYLPIGTDAQKLQNNKIVVTDNVLYENYTKSGLSVKCYVAVNGNEGYIEVPLLYYKGYSANNTNTGEKLEVINGENNVVRVLLPKDYAGYIEIKFQEPVYWRVGEFVTLCSIIILLIYLILNGKSFLRKVNVQ